MVQTAEDYVSAWDSLTESHPLGDVEHCMTQETTSTLASEQESARLQDLTLIAVPSSCVGWELRQPFRHAVTKCTQITAGLWRKEQPCWHGVAKALSLAARATSFEPARRHDKCLTPRINTRKSCQLLQVEVRRGNSESSCFLDMPCSGVLKL